MLPSALEAATAAFVLLNLAWKTRRLRPRDPFRPVLRGHVVHKTCATYTLHLSERDVRDTPIAKMCIAETLGKTRRMPNAADPPRPVSAA